MAELILVPPAYQKTVYLPPNPSYHQSEIYRVDYTDMSKYVQASVRIPQPTFMDMAVNPLDDMINFYTLGKDGSNIINQNLSHDDVSRRFWGKEDIHEMVRRWFHDDLLIQINSVGDTYNYNTEQSKKTWRFCFTDKRDYQTFMADYYIKIKNHRFFAKKAGLFDLENWLKSNTTHGFDIIASYNSAEIFIKDYEEAVHFKMACFDGTEVWE